MPPASRGRTPEFRADPEADGYTLSASLKVARPTATGFAAQVALQRELGEALLRSAAELEALTCPRAPAAKASA